MQKNIMFAFVLLVSIVLFVGCQSNETGKEETHDDIINIDDLLKYKDTYVGDNSAVHSVLRKLPGSRYIQLLVLDTKEPLYGIIVDYGLREGSTPIANENDFEQYWDENNTRMYLLNNAITFFILVQNVDYVTFHLNDPFEESFTITREQLETFYQKDFRQFADNKDLWQKEILEGILNSEDKINDFFVIL